MGVHKLIWTTSTHCDNSTSMFISFLVLPSGLKQCANHLRQLRIFWIGEPIYVHPSLERRMQT